MRPDVIVASPLLRAVQTADILAETLRGKSDLLVVGLLAPGFSLESLDQLLKSFPKAKEIALIGHEPDLGILAQALLSAELSCALKKGMALSVRRAEGSKKADFIRLVTGGGLIITSTGKALDRLQA
jgi:phosphohistidine phosphatase